MGYSQREIEQFIGEEDVKFIRLAFSDVRGNQKNISVMPGELERAFHYGIAFRRFFGGRIWRRSTFGFVSSPGFVDAFHTSVETRSRQSCANVL